MASKSIKGLTVKIGGDTSELGKALEAVNKKGRDLSSELGQINKLLKLDPKNTELLAQKQKVLSDAIKNTADKLKTLKQAEKQVQEQFKRGEVSEEQVRALQREIVATEKKMDGYKKAVKNTGKSLDDMADKADKAGRESEGMGKKLAGVAKGGLKLLTAGLAAAVAALVGSAEASREYRREMGKLDTAFTTNGHSSQAATKTYKELQGVLGETDQAVEAANHLAKLTDNEKDLSTWTNICTGVYATFGASLPIEGLTEAANETAKTGALTGALADALNWAGVNEDDFQASLDACNTEQERQTLIMETLNGLYSDAADKYRETNAEVIRANQANEEWAEVMAEVGGTIEPILTDVKMLGASLVADLVPGVQQVAEAFRGMLNGDAGAASDMGGALSRIFEQILSTMANMLPQVAEMAVSLVAELANSVIRMTPHLVDVGMRVITALLQGVATALPRVVSAFMDMLPVLVPQIVAAADSVIELLAAELPALLPQLTETLVGIVTLLVEQIPVILPQLLEACVTIVDAVIDALPEILIALTEALPALLGAVWDSIVMVFVNLPSWFAQIFKSAWQLIKKIWSVVAEWFGNIWKNIKKAFSPVSDWFKNLFSKAWSGVKNAWSGAASFFSGIWSKVKNTFSNVQTWFKNIFSGAWNAIKNVFSGVSSFFNGIWTKIKNAFTSIGTKIGSAISGAVRQGINNLISQAERIINGFLGMINNAIGLINKIPGVNISKVKLVSFTRLAKGGVVDEPTPAVFGEDGAEAVVPLEKNTEWIQRVAREFTAQVKNEMGADLLSSTGADAQLANSGLMGKLDKILGAIERGQILAIDGKTWVGATLGQTDSALGQRRALVARGAL